jgi:hypothetical protein
MARFNSPLDDVKVAAPCPASWDEMRGDEQVRFCSQCSLNVYNLSGMSKREAESLIARTEGRLCVRFYRRTDGTVLTNNCPTGLRALKRRLSRLTTAIISAVLSFFAGLGIYAGLSERDPVASPTVMGVMAVSGQRSPSPATTRPAIRGEMVREEPTVGRLAITPVKDNRHSPGLRRNIRR